MNCVDFETLLADFLDGTLKASEREELEAHASACAGCRQFMAEAAVGFEFMKRAADVLPPPDLITKIAYSAPMGRTRRAQERQGIFSKLVSSWIQPLLQPRFAMGMAMTILSFAMLERCTGIRVQRIESADLNPVNIWESSVDRVARTKDRAVKYYENIRFVYDIEVKLREMEDQQTQAQEETRRKQRQLAGQKKTAPASTSLRDATGERK